MAFKLACHANDLSDILETPQQGLNRFLKQYIMEELCRLLEYLLSSKVQSNLISRAAPTYCTTVKSTA